MSHLTPDTLSAYLDGELPEKAARKASQHLEQCADCQRQLEILQAAAAMHRPPQARLDAINENVMARLKPKTRNAAAVVGEVQQVRGTVLVRGGAAAECFEAFPGCALRAGDRLEPVNDAEAEVEWANGAQTVISEVTQLDESAASAPPDFPKQKTRHGIMAKIKKQLFTRRQIALGSTAGLLLVAATSFTIYSIVEYDALPFTKKMRAKMEMNEYDKLVEKSAPYSPHNYYPSDHPGPAGKRPDLTQTPAPARILPGKTPLPKPARYGQLTQRDQFDWGQNKNPSQITVNGLAPAPEMRTDPASVFTVNPGRPPVYAKSFNVVAEELPVEHDTEAYDHQDANQFRDVRQHPLSTFSIDVDTASYANVRRFLTSGQRPPPGAVRIEELINYFNYDYPDPRDEAPFSVNVEIAGCPWNDAHRLARIGLKGKEIPWDERPSSNLVFLLDVSGSMNQPNKLPLMVDAMKLLVGRLGENDCVAITVYAGASGLVLPATSGDQQEKILAALDHLRAGGSTHGSAGIKLAYETAQANFIKGGLNRVILATDGDFNVGTTNQSELVELITAKAKSGVFLSVFGFGTGNLKDSTMEKLADKGNGNYGYIDTIEEARKALVEEVGGTLLTIAKDVKIQLEFNPAEVSQYRMIGYENRVLAKEDFNDDKKDAGEIGAGHTVTALYELVPPGAEAQQDVRPVDPLKYQHPHANSPLTRGGELLTAKLRYKQPDGDTSQLLEFPVRDLDLSLAQASGDFKFAAGVAAFGMLLRDSKFKGSSSFALVKQLAEAGRGADLNGYRAEFLQLVTKAAALPAR